MLFERTSVGLDVHARSVVGCALDGVTGEVWRRRLTPDNGQILAWVGSLPGPVGVVYEAGPTGFGLARFLTAAGSGVSSRHPRSCSARPVTESRPMPGTPCIWPSCCTLARSSR
jgi:hypothetical protein